MQNRFIDLYSDTKSKPSPGMRKAMADAEVGDEQKFEDPTVERLRERVCELLGKEDAVFMPSGTMCNQAAVRVHCRLGDEVIADRTAHIINAETGGTAANSGVMIRMLDGLNGVFTADQVKVALRDPNTHGDQFVEVQVVLPKIISEETKDLLRKYGQMNTENPRVTMGLE